MNFGSAKDKIQKSFYEIDNFKQDLVKMYPDTDFRNKIVLWIEAAIFNGNIINHPSTICFLDDEDNDLFPKIDYKNKNIYPNREYVGLAMKRKRFVCQSGLPILFHSFEELSKIKKIAITWQACNIFPIQTEEVYYVNFVKPTENNKKIALYTIASKMLPKESLDFLGQSEENQSKSEWNITKGWLERFETIVVRQKENVLTFGEENCDLNMRTQLCELLDLIIAQNAAGDDAILMCLYTHINMLPQLV